MSEEKFVEWCDSHNRAEWVDGEVIVMPAAVRTDHADIVAFLVTLLRVFAGRRKLGKVLAEPYQVRFGAISRRRSPDVIFVSRNRRSLFKEAHFEGATDLAVEVVSDESQSRDRREKYLEYEAVGVREYWIIDPLIRDVEMHVLTAGKFSPVTESAGWLRSEVLSDFFLRPAWFWQPELPEPLDALAEVDAIKDIPGPSSPPPLRSDNQT
jgi:Uma2 family endonuclease